MSIYFYFLGVSASDWTAYNSFPGAEQERNQQLQHNFNQLQPQNVSQFDLVDAFSSLIRIVHRNYWCTEVQVKVPGLITKKEKKQI